MQVILHCPYKKLLRRSKNAVCEFDEFCDKYKSVKYFNTESLLIY